MCAASERGAEHLRGRRLTPEQVERRRRTARERNLRRYLRPGYHRPWWTKAEVALLGRLPDEEGDKRTGRSVHAVRHKREALRRQRHDAGTNDAEEDATTKRRTGRRSSKGQRNAETRNLGDYRRRWTNLTP
jgi:hypothetical protein